MNNQSASVTVLPMTLLRNMLCASAIFLAAPVAASGCYADYKAKQDNPLRLHYGIVALNSECNIRSAEREIAERLSGSGWVLLNVLSVFGEDQLGEKRNDAGPYYLRF